MSDILSSLAQLQQARASERTRETPETAAPAAADTEPQAQPPALRTAGTDETSEPPLSRGDGKTLAGRVPLALHRELTRGLLDAADALNVRRVNLDEALEAAVRVVLRDPQVNRRWLSEIQSVRRERREE